MDQENPDSESQDNIIILSSDDDSMDLALCEDINLSSLQSCSEATPGKECKRMKLEDEKKGILTSAANGAISRPAIGNAWSSFKRSHVDMSKKKGDKSTLAQSQLTSFFQPKHPKKTMPIVEPPKKTKPVAKPSAADTLKPAAKSWQHFGFGWNKNKVLEKKPQQTRVPNGQSSAGNSKSNVQRNPESNSRKKQCPFYKKIPGTPFTVDAFRYGTIEECKCYFLSHFHYDHYGGLTRHFKHKVCCSKITANLVINQLKVPAANVVSLPMEQRMSIEGVSVTLLDANHCPGSVLFLFELTDGKKILHTGDFRASEELEKYEHYLKCGIDTVYLDTTYCNAQYTFPRQQDVIQFAIDCAIDVLKKYPRTLIACGTYTIGKERVFHALGKIIKCKVGVTKAKKKVLDCLEWSELDKMLTTDFSQAKIHVLAMNALSFQALQTHLDKYKANFDSILAFKPTGWTFSQKTAVVSDIKPMVRGNVTLYGLPYSEHSSYNELEWFIKYVKPKRILPTVNNGDPAKRQAMENIFKDWMKS